MEEKKKRGREKGEGREVEPDESVSTNTALGMYWLDR